MREIVFRGKRIDNGEWVYGDLHHELITRDICIMGKHVIPETVGQYTGLKDRYEVKIYDGDILGGLGHVVWGDSECRYLIDIIGERYEVFFDELSQNELEVIGNIHEGEDDIDTNNNNWHPVTWQEAIQAWANGKVVYVENKAGGRVYRYGGESEKMYLLTSEITTGTWYVED